MVANIRSGASPGGALRYNKEKLDKDEAEVLFWQKMLEPFDKYGRMDVDACMDSFRPYLEANRRTTSTVFHASLNPSPEDRLTDEQLREIAQEYMQKMGYGDQPYIVFKHKDIDREHLHVVSLRVDEQGRKLPHDFEARRSTEILRDLECQGAGTDGQGGPAESELSRGKCQAADLVRRPVVPAELQMLVVRRIPHPVRAV